ncbi:hypothetical protein Tco_0542890 [Tanacetum coccineum]
MNLQPFRPDIDELINAFVKETVEQSRHLEYAVNFWYYEHGLLQIEVKLQNANTARKLEEEFRKWHNTLSEFMNVLGAVSGRVDLIRVLTPQLPGKTFTLKAHQQHGSYFEDGERLGGDLETNYSSLHAMQSAIHANGTEEESQSHRA